MDPSFLFASMQLAQQTQQLRALAQQEHDEETYKAIVRENQMNLLSTVKADSEKAFHEASNFPQRAFVRAQLMMHALDSHRVIPDSFDEQKEKEDVILIWRKLANISNKSKSQMTEEQLNKCVECLNAISTEGFIQVIADRLKAYVEYQEIKPKLENLTKRNKRILSYQKSSWNIITFIGIATFLLYSNRVGFEIAANALIVWILVGCALGLITYLVLESKRPKDLANIDRLFRKLSLASSAEDDGFWQAVKDRFKSIPTLEQLKESWNEQEKVIKSIFGEPAA